MPNTRKLKSVTDAAREKILAVFTVADDMPVWQERTAAFYRDNFPRAFDPEGASEEWNAERAGKPPRWQYIPARGDYVCNAWQRQVSLREVCEAMGLSYTETKKKVDDISARALAHALRRVTRTNVELLGGEPVWKRRTRKSHPKTDMEKLDAFNRDYAGKKLRLRDGCFYLVCRRKIMRDDLMKWLKEG